MEFKWQEPKQRYICVWRISIYFVQNTTFFPPSTCFLCSLAWCTLFIQLCLDISKNKSWILQSRFHCFLLKLSQTIAQGRRISHAPPCKIQNPPPRFFANHAHKRQHFSRAQPCIPWSEFHKEQSSPSDQDSQSTASRNQPGFRLLFQHRFQGRTRRNTIYSWLTGSRGRDSWRKEQTLRFEHKPRLNICLECMRCYD